MTQVPTISANPVESVLYTRTDLETIFLPTKQMLQIDRVLEIKNDHITCELDISNHWVFPMHFPGDAIFPGTLLIEAAGQAVATWAWHAGLRGHPRMVRVKAKFENPVLPEHNTVKLIGSVRLRKNVLLGSVDLFVSEQRAAEIKPVIIIIPSKQDR
jgi:3-hydroxymyristoyl/3-hydroxydecanoyl-(acyl carrier protein) dehydratase